MGLGWLCPLLKADHESHSWGRGFHMATWPPPWPAASGVRRGGQRDSRERLPPLQLPRTPEEQHSQRQDGPLPQTLTGPRRCVGLAPHFLLWPADRQPPFLDPCDLLWPFDPFRQACSSHLPPSHGSPLLRLLLLPALPVPTSQPDCGLRASLLARRCSPCCSHRAHFVQSPSSPSHRLCAPLPSLGDHCWRLQARSKHETTQDRAGLHCERSPQSP